MVALHPSTASSAKLSGRNGAPQRVFRDLVETDRTGASVGQFVNWVVKPVLRDVVEVDDNHG